MSDISMLVKIIYHDCVDEKRREAERSGSDFYFSDSGYDVVGVVDRESIPPVMTDPISLDNYITGNEVLGKTKEDIDRIRGMLQGNLHRVFKDNGIITYKKNSDGYFMQDPESMERGEELSLEDESTYVHADSLAFAATKTYGKYPNKNLKSNRH